MTLPLHSDQALFDWTSLKKLSPWTLNFKQPIPGWKMEVELIGGPSIQVFRADDGVFYFCHGLSFGGKYAPGGAVSPFSGPDVRTILRYHYQLMDPETNASAGDVLVWRGLGDETPHSAILVKPLLAADGETLAISSRVLTKNGLLPEMETELAMLLGAKNGYGDSYQVFRQLK